MIDQHYEGAPSSAAEALPVCSTRSELRAGVHVTTNMTRIALEPGGESIEFIDVTPYPALERPRRKSNDAGPPQGG